MRFPRPKRQLSLYELLESVVNELNACSRNYELGFKASIKEDENGVYRIVYEKEIK